MRRGTLIVFLKAPKAGRVKTRLSREIGAARAAILFRRMTVMTLRQARQGAWRTILAIDPPAEIVARWPCWGDDLKRWAQRGGDLGRRMAAAMRDAAQGPVVIIGADAPALRAGHIKGAFAALGAADAVFGPAEDGGYWLVGLARRRPAPRIFQNVRWSGPEALADTRASLPATFRLAYLPVLRDVDRAKDLAGLGPLLLSSR